MAIAGHVFFPFVAGLGLLCTLQMPVIHIGCDEISSPVRVQRSGAFGKARKMLFSK
jgi:hypothetical protein